jgi:hypothetical protein
MNALLELPARQIVRSIADAAQRWSDADFPPRVRALPAIAQRTGYGLPAVEYALDRLFESLRASALEAAIADELGSLDALDRFVERAGRPPARALPVGPACIVSSRTTIGVAIVPAVFALCAKCPTVVKDREDLLVSSFFATLAQERDAFRSAAVARAWSSAQADYDVGDFAAVVAFGRNETLERIRERCAPEARFVGFGAKASVGYVGRETLDTLSSAQRIAKGAARDLALYETEGCLSLHALFVERGGGVSAERFAELLAADIERTAVEFPVGTREAGDRAALGSARALAAFRAAAGEGRVFSDENATHLLVADPPRSQPPFFLPRALALFSVDSPAEAQAYLQTHAIGLEALATTSQRADVAALAVAAGAARIARFGELQAPLVGGNHGGRARVSDFVRWITNET